MVPKRLQNWSWRGSDRPLGSFPWNKVLPRPNFWWCWIHLGSPFGPSLTSCWVSFLHVFSKWLFDGLGLYLGSQNTSIMRPKRGSKPKVEIHRFCSYLLYFGHIQGCWKWQFLVLFSQPCFGMVFGAHFRDFGSLLGSLLDTILVTFWIPFLHWFLDPLKQPKKERNPFSVLAIMDTVSPLLGLLPPS